MKIIVICFLTTIGGQQTDNNNSQSGFSHIPPQLYFKQKHDETATPTPHTIHLIN